MSEAVWITWENHRRSRELASALGVPLIVESSPFPRGISHLHKSIKFIFSINVRRPRTVFVQNPSIVLAFVASLLKYIYKYRLIVDRHTNFRLGKKKGLNPYGYFFDFISDFSLRNADVTIVTNDHLQKIVKDKGGRGFVLEDLLPKFSNLKKQTLTGRFNAVFICTYAADEPYNQVIEAAKLLPDDLHIYITGKIPKKFEFRKLPNNVFLTGFLPEDEYSSLLHSAQLIMDFTSLEWCLVCGGYEALALGKPFLTSATITLNSLFGDAVLYTEHSVDALAHNIQLAREQAGSLEVKMVEFGESFKKTSEQKVVLLQQAVTECLSDA